MMNKMRLIGTETYVDDSFPGTPWTETTLTFEYRDAKFHTSPEDIEFAEESGIDLLRYIESAIDKMRDNDIDTKESFTVGCEFKNQYGWGYSCLAINVYREPPLIDPVDYTKKTVGFDLSE